MKKFVFAGCLPGIALLACVAHGDIMPLAEKLPVVDGKIRLFVHKCGSVLVA